MNKLPEELERRVDDECDIRRAAFLPYSLETAFVETQAYSTGFEEGVEYLYSLLQKEPELNPLWPIVEAARYAQKEWCITPTCGCWLCRSLKKLGLDDD